MSEAAGSLCLGFIGTGIMGRSMARHLMEAGFPLRVHSRTRSRAAPLEEAGASWAESPRALAESVDAVISIVGLPSDVEAVHLGPEGTLAARPAPRLIVDMTTSRPALAIEIAQRARAAGSMAVDAPVSGGDVGARQATLSIMIGGDDDAVAAAMPLLRPMGRTLVHHGGPGCGQHAKMVNQILVGGVMSGLSEGLLYAQHAGLDLDRVLTSVSSGAAGSWSLTNYGPRILAGDFDPGFAVEHFVKDLGIALDEARRLGVAIPGSAVTRQLYVALEAQGGGGSGVHALVLALARMSGQAWERSADTSTGG